MKRVIMVAYHYPPIRGSSGVHRTLKFSQYLPQFGWQPSVLTVHPRAYPAVRTDQLDDVPDGLEVVRAFALDTSRHLSFGGRYPALLARPDRWVSWWLGGVLAGMRMARRRRPALIWSTYPIATAHLIGASLQRHTGLPWVADFRDSMTEETYPRDPRTWQSYRAIERRTVERAASVVFTTPGTSAMYRERYPQLPQGRWQCISNGFDEEAFAEAESGRRAVPAGRPVILLHSGLLYPVERDPRPFLDAVAELATQRRLQPGDLLVRLRASGYLDQIRRLIVERRIEGFVELAPSVPYREALREMLSAHGLLLFQAASCNHQIPAKLYEYLRAGRPILALTDAAGDTAAALRQQGVDTILPLDDKEAIKRGLVDFLQRVGDGTAPVGDPERVREYSRHRQTAQLARLFDSLCA